MSVLRHAMCASILKENNFQHALKFGIAHDKSNFHMERVFIICYCVMYNGPAYYTSSLESVKIECLFLDASRNGYQQGCIYRLIGTVEHLGTMRGGHYVAYVMGPANDDENEADSSSREVSTWYYISDSHVRKTSLESVLRSEAYLLFYERQASN